MKTPLRLLLLANILWLAACTDENNDSARKVHKPIWNETYTDLLKRDLLMSYDKFARPSQHINQTSVIVDLQLKHVDFDEASSIFTIYAWFSMQWNDDKLRWNESDYDGIWKLVLAQHEIWEPDLRSYNALSNEHFQGMFNFYVKSDGTVTWIPSTVFKVLCDSNLRYWPYDTHKCELIIGSWVHSGDEIDIFARSPHTEFELYTENPEWEIVDFAAGRVVTTYACCPEPYVTIRYNITIERRASIYRHVIIAPTFVIMILILITFWLPATYGEKVLLNGVATVMTVLFLLYFSQKLNIMATHTPLIVLFFKNTLYLSCFSTLISVIVINLTRMHSPRPLPWFIRRQLDGKLRTYLCLDHIAEIEHEAQPHAAELHPFGDPAPNDDHQLINPNEVARNRIALKNDYIRLATAIDRVAFLFVLILFMFFFILYI